MSRQKEDGVLEAAGGPVAPSEWARPVPASELRRLAGNIGPTGPWFHVERPWIDVPGYVWTAEDPHVGYLVADCNGTAEPINFAEWIAAASPATVLWLLKALEEAALRIAELEAGATRLVDEIGRKAAGTRNDQRCTACHAYGWHTVDCPVGLREYMAPKGAK